MTFRKHLTLLLAWIGMTICSGLPGFDLLGASGNVHAGLVVSEIMYNPMNGGDFEFLEILNTGTEAIDLADHHVAGAVTYTFTNSWPLAANERVVIAGDRDQFVLRYGDHPYLAPDDFLGRLANEGELVQLLDPAGNLLFQVHYFPDAPWPPGANGFDFSLVLIDPLGEPNDPSNWGVSAEQYGSPGFAGQAQVQDVLINEVMDASAPPFEDAVELINISTNPVNISGWTLSNASFDLARYHIPSNTVIPAGGFAVLYESDFNDAGNPTNTPFELGLRGSIYLSEVNAFGQPVRIVDFAAFEPIPINSSQGRYPDGSRGIKPLLTPSFGVASPVDLANFRTGGGAPNPGPAVGPLVITEIMYHPHASNDVEYLELMNIHDAPVELSTDHALGGPWYLSPGIFYRFPTNTILAPGEIVLLTSTNATRLRAAYPIPESVRIFEDWQGNLSNDGEALSILSFTPGERVTLLLYPLDTVTYNDQLPWPLAADGFGASLERITPSGFGNVVTNWQPSALGGSPGLPNPAQPPAGSVIISEIMAYNFRGLADEDGSYSDWIELQNLSGTDIPLDGWFLTDDTLDLHKWRIPDVILPANGFLLIFASGQDRTEQAGELHANFQLDNDGEFLALIRPDGVRIEHALSPAYPAQFPDLAYGGSGSNLYYEIPTPGTPNGTGFPSTAGYPVFSHPGGVYTNGLVLTLSSPLPGTLIRFTTDGSAPTPASMPYTDPLIIDGPLEVRARVYRSGATPGPVISRMYRRTFLGLNEFMARNSTVFAEMLDFGDYVDWLELYNADTNAVDLGGYYLTDNLDEPFKWMIPTGLSLPADATAIIMADGEDQKPGVALNRDWWPGNPFTTSWYHTNFKLSSTGEELALHSPNGSLIDHVVYYQQANDVSYGRLPGGGDWRYYGEPTPDAANQGEALTTNCHYTAAVELSQPGGFMDQPLSITLTHPSTHAVIVYTLDGSDPTREASAYGGPIPLSSNTVLRTRAFESGLLPSAIRTETYLFGELPDELPTLSFTVDPERLYAPTFGIVENSLKRREVPAHVTYFDEKGEQVFAEDLGVRLSGLNIFRFAQKPFSFFFRGRFGESGIEVQLFKDNPSGFYDRFVLRNGGDDWQAAMMRDALCQELVRDRTELLVQCWKPVRVFHNGAYYGLMFLRDKSDESMLTNNYGIDPEETDYIETNRTPGGGGLNAAAGDTEEIFRFLYSIIELDYTVPGNLAALLDQVDEQNLHDFTIAQMYSANSSWPGNRSYWRMRQPDGKWRLPLLDMDRGFRGAFLNSDSLSTLIQIFSPWHLGLVDEAYTHRFIQRSAAQLNTTYHPDRVIATIDRLQGQMEAEMPRQIARWSSQAGIASYNNWLAQVEVLRNFARQRPAIVRQHIINNFGLSGTVDVVFEQPDSGQGTILSDFTSMDNLGATNVFFKDVPMQLKAVPEVGARFVAWEIHTNGSVTTNTQAEFSFTPTSGTTVTARFEPDASKTIGAELASDTVLTADGNPWLSTGDIIVPSNTTLRIESGVELYMREHASLYVYGKLEVAGTPTAPVHFFVNTNASARLPVFRDLSSVPLVLQEQRWGGIAVDRATDPAELKHLVIRDASSTPDHIRFKAAISGWHSDIHMDGLDLDRVDFPIFIQYGDEQRLLNSRIHTDVVSDLINVKYARYARVEGCDLRGDLAPDTDAIDFDNLGQGGEIRNNYIHDFLGPNSDAIDVGEGATNVVVVGNLIRNCTDKGVSVGQASQVEIRNNLIIDCAQGVGIKDTGSHALIDGNTLVNNGYGVAVFEKNKGAGGGSAEIRNTIITGSTTNSVFVDALSSATSAYNLVDDTILTGTGNWMGSPLFADPGNTNYTIRLGSLAVDHGDPSHPLDPDGTRADIGAFPLDQDGPLLVITEIHYHPAKGASNEYEFLEILNAGQQAIDLTDYSIGGLNFVFPTNTMINAGELILLAAQSNHYANLGVRVFEWTAGSLNNAGESIRILDASSNRIDRVRYASRPPWPETPDGRGPSLVLLHPFLDNDAASSWSASHTLGGSPGQLSFSMQVQSLALEHGANPFHVDILSITGLQYQLEFTTDLNHPDWQAVSNPVIGSGATIRLTHAGGSLEESGFYRIAASY